MNSLSSPDKGCHTLQFKKKWKVLDMKHLPQLHCSVLDFYHFTITWGWQWMLPILQFILSTWVLLLPDVMSVAVAVATFVLRTYNSSVNVSWSCRMDIAKCVFSISRTTVLLLPDVTSVAVDVATFVLRTYNNSVTVSWSCSMDIANCVYSISWMTVLLLPDVGRVVVDVANFLHGLSCQTLLVLCHQHLWTYNETKSSTWQKMLTTGCLYHAHPPVAWVK